MRAVSLTAGLERLGEVRSFLAGSLPEEYASLTPSVELILEEFLVNVVTHAYGGRPGPLEVSLREVMFDGRPHVAIKVVDWGPPFDPFSDAPEPDVALSLDERPIGGLGLRLIRSLVAHHSYFRAAGSNTAEVWVPRP
jgi:anti-sigma regulatory factor (Ser/Thr protein kinase)